VGPEPQQQTARFTPRSGAQNLRLAIVNTDNSFAGAFQDVPITSGMYYTFSGWNLTSSSPLELTPEIRIEWRNSTAITEISRTPNLSRS
jgi:hypothetical protein